MNKDGEFFGRTRVWSTVNRRIAADELKALGRQWFLGDGQFSVYVRKVAERRETERLVRAMKKRRKK